MLDDVTKKRINTLRQILVGKLPDPKAQVEQITNGLIYKFMNDMDEQSVSMGGKSTYFSGKFEKYSWKNLMDTKTSGVEKIKLYSEAIEQMYNNENLPELFREIFKNSFLPFKDPSTLNMFLKEINEFHYSHSEKLGDAFEYLLSFMGSQGDAGQFRTPRHIIDFIVETVNPQKNETILDPACGTAGFLISSYKHILSQNTKKNLGDRLTVSDRKKIGENLNGYDISPDMVKMSLVNMYLNKFTNPKINEYDTLSNEERWNEYYDVILANPPFFSPKGGITPHNRFGTKSKRAEILFIDYITQHLKPMGRAGIVVPEGIIFDNDKSYTEIRKKLVNNGLIAVISLPRGVFLPYTPVKTNILLLNKSFNNVTKKIFFASINSDGFDLGAQRKKVDQNDLPYILQNFTNFIKGEKLNSNLINLIKKDEILKNKDHTFIHKKYSDIKRNSKRNYEKLSEIFDIFSGSRDKGGSKKSGIPSIGGKQISSDGKILKNAMVYISEDHFKKMKKGRIENNDILIVKDGATTGKLGYYNGEFENAAVNEHVFILRAKKNYNPKLLYQILKSKEFEKLLKPYIQGIIGGINLSFGEIEIPILNQYETKEFLEFLDEQENLIDKKSLEIDKIKKNLTDRTEKIWSD